MKTNEELAHEFAEQNKDKFKDSNYAGFFRAYFEGINEGQKFRAMENDQMRIDSDGVVWQKVTEECKSWSKRVSIWDVFNLYELKEDKSVVLLETADNQRNALLSGNEILIKVGKI